MGVRNSGSLYFNTNHRFQKEVWSNRIELIAATKIKTGTGNRYTNITIEGLSS